jgi:hypothetical protein
MAWYFAANNFAQDGLERLPDNFDILAGDLDLFVNNTVMELEHVTGANLDELQDNIENDINDAVDSLDSLVLKLVNNTGLSDLIKIADFFNSTAQGFVNQKKDELTVKLTGSVDSSITDFFIDNDNFLGVIFDNFR